MKYFDLLNLKSKYTQVLQQIVAMEEQDTKIFIFPNVLKMYQSYLLPTILTKSNYYYIYYTINL